LREEASHWAIQPAGRGGGAKVGPSLPGDEGPAMGYEMRVMQTVDRSVLVESGW
jgi:hypothetical protein